MFIEIEHDFVKLHIMFELEALYDRGNTIVSKLFELRRRQYRVPHRSDPDVHV